jgi:hypothetical protein
VIVGMYTPDEISTFHVEAQQPIQIQASPQTIDVEPVPEVPSVIASAKNMQELVEAFQYATRGWDPSTEYYKACQAAATERKASL